METMNSSLRLRHVSAVFTVVLLGLIGATAVAGPAGAEQPVSGGIGTGAVSIKGSNSELLPGVTVEIRQETCEGAAVWRTTTTDRPDAYGAFGIGLAAGQYCVTTISVPAGFVLPADVLFTMENRAANWVTVWVPRPYMQTVVSGAVVAKDAWGVPINGVTAHVSRGSCASPGTGVWENTTAANRWADGGFGIGLGEGLHCIQTLAVPAGYSIPQPFEVAVASPSPIWITVWVPGGQPPVQPSQPSVPNDPYYANCTAVRAANAAPIYAGQPGYGRHLDRDGDGVGCEV